MSTEVSGLEIQQPIAGAAETKLPSLTPLGRDWLVAWRNWLSLAAFLLNLGITYASLSGDEEGNGAFGKTNTALSLKYQTLVTPAGYAFSIWGAIFIWEGVWAVCQLFPFMASSPGVAAAAPGWWAACLAQACWTFAFAQEFILLSVVFMLCICASLVFTVMSTDSISLNVQEYMLQRAPFALHLGWVIAASAVNINVVFDYFQVDEGVAFTVANISLAAVVLAAVFFATKTKTKEPIVPLVAAWALFAIAAELNKNRMGDAAHLNRERWAAAPGECPLCVTLIGWLRMLVFFMAFVACALAAVAIFGNFRTGGACARQVEEMA